MLTQYEACRDLQECQLKLRKLSPCTVEVPTDIPRDEMVRGLLALLDARCYRLADKTAQEIEGRQLPPEVHVLVRKVRLALATLTK